MTDSITQIADLIDPAVYAPIVSYELQKALRFTPLTQVDNTLVGNSGDTLHFPKFTYMGDAEDVAEGQPIPEDKLGTKDASVKVKKAAKGTGITDEAVLSGYGDPVGESQKQLGLAMASKIDNDLLAVAKTGTQKVTMTADVEGVQAGLDVFNEEDDSPIVLVVSPKTASAIRKDAIEKKIGSEVGANELVKGTYLDVLGVQIVRSRKLADTEAIFVKASQTSPALKLVMKRGINIESQREAKTATTHIYATEHYAAYLYDDTKVVVGTVAAPASSSSASTGK